MKKLQPFLVFLFAFLFFFSLVFIERKNIYLAFQKDQKLFSSEERSVLLPKEKTLNLDFLLKFKKIAVVAIYEDGNMAYYDPQDKLDKFSYTYAGEGRYFREDDYTNKTDVYVLIQNQSFDFPVEKEEILRVHQWGGYQRKENYYYIYNLLAKQKNIKRLIFFGEEQAELYHLLVKKGCVKEEIYTQESFFDLMRIDTRLSAPVLLYTSFFYATIFGSFFFVILRFYIQQKEMYLHYLAGLTFQNLVKKHLLPLSMKMFLVFSLVAFFYSKFFLFSVFSFTSLVQYTCMYFCAIQVFLYCLAYLNYKKMEVMYCAS